MAKKKKKKGDKTPYVHIDILPAEEQFPDASIAPEAPNQPQGHPVPGARGQQRMNDPRRRGEGFEPYAAEVVSASEKGLSKKKADGNAPIAGDDDSEVAPFVIPVFRKSDIPQQRRGMHPMQQRMYSTGQFPAVGGGVPNGNPQQNLTQIQQNLLNQHNVARQQAAHRPMGQQPTVQQMGQAVPLQAAQSLQQGISPTSQQPTAQMGQQLSTQQMQQHIQQLTAQAAIEQNKNNGQFASVSNSVTAQQPQQQPQQQHQQPQVHAQARPIRQSSNPQATQPLPMQGTQVVAQGAIQAASAAAAARATQSHTTVAQAAIQATAQAHQPSRQSGHLQAAANAGTQPISATSQVTAFQQRQGATAAAQPSAHPRPAQGNQTQVAAAAISQQPPASQAPGSFGKDIPGAAVAVPNAKLTDDSSGDAAGKPLLDPKAAEESTMFDKPPVPIEEGMRKSTSGHKVRRRLILTIVILAVVLGGGFAAYMLLSEQGVVPRISIETATVPVTSPDSSSAGNSSGNAASAGTDSDTAAGTSSGSDLSGTVVYEYTANTASGVEYKVKETVTFQSNGDCQSSTMDMTFPDAASAKTFTDNLARDYGTSFKLDSLNGNNAVVTIDNSGLHLTRDEYENALRYSVSDLVVTK